jgi:hypothetical protein
MAKKKRMQFGLPAAEHKTIARRLARRVREISDEAGRYGRLGHCALAIASFGLASRTAGQMAGHTDSAYLIMEKDTPEISDAWVRLFKAENDIKSGKCGRR